MKNRRQRTKSEPIETIYILVISFLFGIGIGVIVARGRFDEEQLVNKELRENITSLKKDLHVMEKQQEVLLKALGWQEEN